MNDALWSWFWALSSPLNPDSPVSGLSTPITSNRLPVSGSVPALSTRIPAPNQYFEHVADEVARAVQRAAQGLDRRVRRALCVVERVVELAAVRRRVLVPANLPV